MSVNATRHSTVLLRDFVKEEDLRGTKVVCMHESLSREVCMYVEGGRCMLTYIP